MHRDARRHTSYHCVQSTFSVTRVSVAVTVTRDRDRDRDRVHDFLVGGFHDSSENEKKLPSRTRL